MTRLQGYNGKDGAIFVTDVTVETWQRGATTSLPRFRLDGGTHGRCVGGGFESRAEFLSMEQFCNSGQGVQVLLKLALGNEKKHDERDGLVVQRVEVHPVPGSAEGADDFMDEIGRGMRDADAGTG